MGIDQSSLLFGEAGAEPLAGDHIEHLELSRDS